MQQCPSDYVLNDGQFAHFSAVNVDTSEIKVWKNRNQGFHITRRVQTNQTTVQTSCQHVNVSVLQIYYGFTLRRMWTQIYVAFA